MLSARTFQQHNICHYIYSSIPQYSAIVVGAQGVDTLRQTFHEHVVHSLLVHTIVCPLSLCPTPSGSGIRRGYASKYGHFHSDKLCSTTTVPLQTSNRVFKRLIYSV